MKTRNACNASSPALEDCSRWISNGTVKIADWPEMFGKVVFDEKVWAGREIPD